VLRITHPYPVSSDVYPVCACDACAATHRAVVFLTVVTSGVTYVTAVTVEQPCGWLMYVIVCIHHGQEEESDVTNSRCGLVIFRQRTATPAWRSRVRGLESDGGLEASVEIAWRTGRDGRRRVTRRLRWVRVGPLGSFLALRWLL
jgi:hypothetical protein